MIRMTKTSLCSQQKTIHVDRIRSFEKKFGKENSLCVPRVTWLPCGWREGRWSLSPPCYCRDCDKKLGHAVPSQYWAAFSQVFPPWCLLQPYCPMSCICALYRDTLAVYGCKVKKCVCWLKSRRNRRGKKAADLHLFYVSSTRRPRCMQSAGSAGYCLIRSGGRG